VRDHVMAYRLENGRLLPLICHGAPIMGYEGNGLPTESQDVQLAAQIVTVLRLIAPGMDIKPGLHELPHELENDIVLARLASLGHTVET